VIQRLKTEQAVEEETVPLKAPKARNAISSDNFGISVRGIDDVLVRLAKCCTPVPGDEVVGYISLGKGITIHREDCSNVKALRRNPERFTKVSWDGGASQSFRVQIAVDSWDRPRLLEDVARTFAEHGANIVEYGGHVEELVRRPGRGREGPAQPPDRAPQPRGRVRRLPRDAVVAESLAGGIVPRTGGVPRTGDGGPAGRRLQREQGRGLSQSCGARPLRGRRTGARHGRPVAAGRPRQALASSPDREDLGLGVAKGGPRHEGPEAALVGGHDGE
jgi:hypothetical protein